MANTRVFERAIKACYSTWSDSYSEDYYGPKAAYPPVHVALIQSVLRKAKARRILDAGCGPASILRRLEGKRLDLYGFDLTPEMVQEARRVMAGRGVPEDHFWEGSVLSRFDFRPPGRKRQRLAFDAVLCTGVLPHIPAETDVTALANLRAATRPGGLVIVEARNQLFSLFTLNRYTHEFFVRDLMRGSENGSAAQMQDVAQKLEGMLRTDLPPIRKGKAGEPGYDEVISRTHNPIVLRDLVARSGFTDVQVLFYHYHCAPPMFEGAFGSRFRELSLALEDPTDWRGYFMASAFLVTGRRRGAS